MSANSPVRMCLRFLRLAVLVSPISCLSSAGVGQSKISLSNSTLDPANIVGTIGAVPVSIPQKYAYLVEYEGDPSPFLREKYQVKRRTYSSRIRSFGFEAHFPDMSGLTQKELKERPAENIYTTDWVSVGVVPLTDYDRDDNFDGTIEALTSGRYSFYKYRVLTKLEYGLTVFQPVDVKPGAANIIKNRNVYVHRNSKSQADLYIVCVNAGHAAAPCSMRFMIPPPMKTYVTIEFRIGLLGSWEQMQHATNKLIQSFSFSN